MYSHQNNKVSVQSVTDDPFQKPRVWFKTYNGGYLKISFISIINLNLC